VARAVGGLADTIEDFNPRKESGVGFVFKDFDKWQLFAQIVRALEVYSHQNMWKGLVSRAMIKDFSWKTSAKRYLELYGKAIHFRKQLLISEGQIPFGGEDQ
jgi:starch synthase